MVICVKRPKVTVSDLLVSSHHRVSDFYLSSWQPGDCPSPVLLLVIRAVLALVAVVILAWSVHEAEYSPYWLIFLTNWGLALIAAMMVSGVAVSVLAVLKKISPETTQLPWLVSTYWVIYNTSISISFVISALYWILLYDPELKKMSEPSAFWLDIVTHSFNSILAVTELLVSRTPVNFLHIYQPLSVGLWYCIFTYLYYICGGTDANGMPYIYEVLDWRYKKRSFVIVGVSIVGLIAMWCLVYATAYGRGKISTLLFRTRTARVTPENGTVQRANHGDYIV